MKVLVCGGRDFRDWALLRKVLDDLHETSPITEIIEGGARGADALAGKWAKERNIPLRVFPANWDKYGGDAGPIRNLQMLEEGKPDFVVAFPGSGGTANMVGQARRAGIPMTEIRKT